ncbi:MAG: DUF3696 domain-containing protein, partial [Bryobacteraceae bacterium]
VHLQFEGIRCFAEPQDAVIRPITLLVGENSSGKTTFLALCRIAYAIANRMQTVPLFNEAPFFLGAYEQIATRRSARKGPVESFSVAILLGGAVPSSLRYEYASRVGQPTPRAWRLEVGGLAIQHTEQDGVPPSVLMRSSGREARFPFAPFADGATQDHPPALWGSLMAPEIEAAGGAGVFTQSDWESVDQALRSIQQELRRRPYAIAPIRTSPLRTYDPISAAPSPEGSHIPMVLASLSRSAHQEQWNSVRSDLREFGSKSGLFDEIEIVNKGKKDSDPFQVGVKSGGRMFNLIDVGYGVSQALPILVETLQRASQFETFLIQQPEVHLHPKAQAELGSFFANQTDPKRRFVIETHSDYLVDRIRMEVRRRLLEPEDVSLLYFERGKSGTTIHNLELDRNGTITNPPPGFRQFFLKEELDLLGV